MKEIKRSVYVTSDGKEFLDKTKAVNHQYRCNLSALLEKHGVGSGGHWDREMILDVLVAEQNQLINIVRELTQ